MTNVKISTYELVLSLSKAIDLVSSRLADHHVKVALISLNLCNELQLPEETTHDILLAAALHDIGALSLKDRLTLLSFETDNPHEHARIGYRLLKSYKPFFNASEIVKYHHVSWSKGDGAFFRGNPVPLGSHIIHLADRISVLLGSQRDVLIESSFLTNLIIDRRGTLFNPDVVDAFTKIAERESFWLEAASPAEISHSVFPSIATNESDLLELTKLFSKTIDFRSRFTVTHSGGVAVCARNLAKLLGFSEKESLLIETAGYLHDLGKMAIPINVLEKPSALTKEENRLIRGHTYYTYRILAPLKELATINTWASYHHERLDGLGYPFRLKADQLSLGSRIISAADIFTAILEDRPYRPGMPQEKALRLLKNMRDEKALDPNIVSLIVSNFDALDAARMEAQKESFREYNYITQ